MIPKLLLKALTAVASNPEVRRRVMAAANNPETRRKVTEAAGKGVDSFRKWWAARESRSESEVSERPMPRNAPMKDVTPKGKPKAGKPRKKSA